VRPGAVADDLGAEVGVAVDGNDNDANVLLAPGSDDGDAMANNSDDAIDLLAGGRDGRPADESNGGHEMAGVVVMGGFCKNGDNVTCHSVFSAPPLLRGINPMTDSARWTA
jgi:hypothetical protein